MRAIGCRVGPKPNDFPWVPATCQSGPPRSRMPYWLVGPIHSTAAAVVRSRLAMERWLSGLKRRFAKPLYGLRPVPGVRIPPSPVSFQFVLIACRRTGSGRSFATARCEVLRRHAYRQAGETASARLRTERPASCYGFRVTFGCGESLAMGITQRGPYRWSWECAQLIAWRPRALRESRCAVFLRCFASHVVFPSAHPESDTPHSGCTGGR